MDIHPTHSAFDDAIELLIWIMEKKPEGRAQVGSGDIRIVHAIFAPEGVKLNHAWLERGESVIFMGLIDGEKVVVTADRTEYYSKSHVTKTVRYTIFEAYAEEKKTGHYGPWDPEIRTLCGDVKAGKTNP